MENEIASSAPEISLDAVDLDTIEQDLADVETALARLEAGTYWTCETTGQELPSDLLAAQPTARSITSL
jgi:RNA polymerase-binding transcription factor DksA